MRRQARAAARGDSGARWSLFASFADGMQTLIDAPAARLPEGAVRRGASIRELARAADGRWRVVLATGEVIESAHVVLTPPAFVIADLVRPHDPALAERLAGIAHASSAIVTLAYTRSQVSHPLDGFGFVVPAIEGRRIIAGTFSSVKYEGRAPAGQVLLRVFLGGALAEGLATLPEAELLTIAEQELADLVGVRGAPSLVRVVRHLRAMPQYELGHLARMVGAERRSRGSRVSRSRGAPTAASASRTASTRASAPWTRCTPASASSMRSSLASASSTRSSPASASSTRSSTAC